MAAVDKTYIDNYDDWKRIIDWAKDTEFVCKNGLVFKVIDYCYYPDATEEEIKNWLKEAGSIPVMNTSIELDYYLIKYCPIDIIQNRMKEVYDEDYYNSIKNNESEYDNDSSIEIGKNIFIKKRKSRNNYFSKGVADITAIYQGIYLTYNDELQRFLWPNELGYHTSDDFYKIKSVKSLIRKLRKMNLPKGTFIIVEGFYIHEHMEILIK